MRQLWRRFDRWADGSSWPLVLAVGVVVVAVVPWTSYQGHAHWARVEWVPFLASVRMGDAIANILLYGPLGYAASLRSRSRGLGQAAVLSLVLSSLTEWSQVFSHGRFPSAADIVCNVLGACVGAVWCRQRTQVRGPAVALSRSQGTS
jgi:glycopeptide antibiotics resistance protein